MQDFVRKFPVVFWGSLTSCRIDAAFEVFFCLLQLISSGARGSERP